MGIDVYSVMGRKKEKKKIDVYSVMGRGEALVSSPSDTRTQNERYTISKRTIKADAFAKDNPFKQSKKSVDDFKDIDPFAKTTTQIDSIDYNYLGSTPIEKLYEDKNNTDDFNKIIYEAVTNDTAEGKSVSELTNVSKKNNGVVPKINTYSLQVGALSGADIDNLINNYSKYESIYKKALSQIKNNGKLDSDTNQSVVDSINALKNSGKTESERKVANEYASIFQNLANGNWGTYLSGRYAQGAASGIIDATAGVSVAAKDIIASALGKETESDKIQKISDYFKNNPAEKNNLNHQGSRFLLASKIGVSEKDLEAYNNYTLTQRVSEEVEKKGNNLNETAKTIVGGIAETLGGVTTSMAVGNAFGVDSNTTSMIKNIQNKEGFSKIAKDLFKITPQNAVYGAGTFGSETISLAQKRGYNPLNTFTAAAKGYAETVAENIGGVEELEWFETTLNGSGKAVLNHFLDSFGEVAEEEFTLIAQNVIDKVMVDNSRSWFGTGGVFDGQEILNTAITSFAIGELFGGAKIVTDISADKYEENAKTKNTLNFINESIPKKYRSNISKDNIHSASKKILQSQKAYLSDINDSLEKNVKIQKETDTIMKTALKAMLLKSGTTKQAVADMMSERGYTPSQAITNELKNNANAGDLSEVGLSADAAETVSNLTAKLDTAFAAAWYGDNGIIAASEAANLYVKAVAVGDAVSAIKIANDAVNNTALSTKQADKLINKAAALLPFDVENTTSGTVTEKAQNIINSATDYITQVNEQTADISQDYFDSAVDALRSISNEEIKQMDKAAQKALSDVVTGINVDQNVNTVLKDDAATKALSKILGVNITGKSDVNFVTRKVRDMISAYSSGNGEIYSTTVNQKTARAQYTLDQLERIGADATVIEGFKNAIYNGKLSREQAEAIAKNKDAFKIFTNLTAGKLTTKSKISDIIKAAGLVGGFDFSADINAYTNAGYTQAEESDVLLPGGEVGLYDNESGKVVLNKKAELNKKLGYKLAQELLNETANDRFLQRDARYDKGELSKELISKTLERYNIENLNDYIHVQRTVFETLLNEGFFDNGEIRCKVVINESSGMPVEINKKSIHETFNLDNFTKIGKIKKYLKLIALDIVPEAISHGEIIADNVPNKHNVNKRTKFAYISYNTKIESLPVELRLAVKKSESKNKLWVHSVYIKKDTSGQDVISENGHGTSYRTAGISNIKPQKSEKVNSFKNDNTLTESVINYMRSNGYNLGTEVDRVVKKYNAYIMEHRARLNSSLLSEENLRNELAADFLTKVFTEDKTMQAVADNDLDFAVDLIERVKEFAKASPDSQLKDFAENVCNNMLGIVTSEDKRLELDAVLQERAKAGLNTSSIDEYREDGKVNMTDPNDITTLQKINRYYNDTKRALVDSGEAIDRLSKKLGNETIYHLYNNTKQSKQAISYMLEKAQTDIEGNKIGKSLKEIFTPIIANENKYKTFCLYMQHINNAERAVYDKAIFTNSTRENSLRLAENYKQANPEFETWAKDVYDYVDNLMQWLIDSGCLSQQEYDVMRKQNPHYVPALFVEETVTDKPSFKNQFVVKKGVTRAQGGVDSTMPLLDALQIKTKQIITESKSNLLANEIFYTLERKGLLEDSPKGLEVKDAALKEYVYNITAVRNSNYFEPAKADGKYITTKTNRDLENDIKHLFNFSKKKEANELIKEYVKKLTLDESFNASDATALANKLAELSVVYNTDMQSPYYNYPELRKDLANTRIYVSPEIVNEIADYNDFRRSAMGRLILTQKQETGVLHVDDYYTMLSREYPGLFDSKIVNSTDQLLKIYEVATKTLKKPSDISLKEYYGEGYAKFVENVIEEIKTLSIDAIKTAHNERAQLTQQAEANTFVKYNPDNLNNMEFSKSEQDGNRMAFYRDGIRYTMDIGRGVYEGLKNISYDPEAKYALEPMQKFNDAYKRLITSYNPFFSARNFSRDLQDAILFSSDSKTMVKNIASGRVLKEILENGELWQLYQSLGGMGNSYFDFKKQLELDVDNSNKAKFKKGWDKATGALEALNQVVEQIPRFAEFITVLEKGDGSFASKQKALYAAADVTVNFGRSGVYAKMINSTIVPFYNPGVQGLSRYVRLFTQTKGIKPWIYLIAKLLVFGFTAGAINEFINFVYHFFNEDEEDTYAQLTDYQKQSNILIPIGDGRYFKIPKGRAVNVIGIGVQTAANAIKGEDVDLWSTIKTAAEQIAPNNPFTDNIVAPVVQAGFNKTWYGTDIESKADEGVEASQRFDESTDYFSRWLGKVLNYSPKKINYLLNQYTGVLGDYLLPIMTPKGTNDVAENVLLTAMDNLIVDGTVSNRVSSDYYSHIDELTYQVNDVYNNEPTAAKVTLKFMNSQTEAIRSLYDEIHEVNNSSLSPTEKAEKSRELKATLSGIMLNAMEFEDKVYQAAENFNSKYAYKKDGTYYNNEGDELTYDEYVNVAYREINRQLFGAEYALKKYSKDVYEKATEAFDVGATYDLYYDAYFDLKAIEGDVDFTNGKIKTGSERKNKWVYINSMDASKTEKTALARTLLNISSEKVNKAKAYGVDAYDYVDFVCDTGAYSSDKKSTKKQKVLSYINRMNISSREKDALYTLAGYSKKTIYEAPWR